MFGVWQICGEMNIFMVKCIDIIFRNVLFSDYCCLVDNELLLMKLVKLESICVLEVGEEVLMFVIVLVGDMEVLVLMVGLIDKSVELGCLDKEIQCLEGEVKCVGGKLFNEGFVVKVLVDVIEKECVKFVEVEQVLVKLVE